MIRDLVDVAVNMVRAEREDDVEELADERAAERLLDLLLPKPASSPPVNVGRVTPPESGEGRPHVFVVGTEGAEVRDVDVDVEEGIEARRERTREKLRALLLEGKLEEREVEIEVSQTPSIEGMVVPMGGGMEGMDHNFTEMLQDMLPKRKKRRTVSVAEARRILVQDEMDRLIDMDEVVNEALVRAEDMGIVFLDEIDKIVGERSGGPGPDVSREGVQRDILPIVEGSTVQTKYGLVRTDHVLFVAAGAFHVAKPSDMIPELQGTFSHSGRTEEPRRGGLRPNSSGAEECAGSSIQGVGGYRGCDPRVHEGGDRGSGETRRRIKRPDGEYRGSPATDGAYDTARVGALRTSRGRPSQDRRGS